jgi:hypothetical protein
MSADILKVLGLPSLDSMAPKGKRLKAIMETDHRDDLNMLQCIAADWDKKLAPSNRRWASVILDVTLKPILGWKRDSVVGFKNQKLGLFGGGTPLEIHSVHVKNFDLEYVKTDTHQMLMDNL